MVVLPFIQLLRSPGFGIFLTAETNEGVFYHGEAMSKPVNSSDEPATAEEIGKEAAEKLLTEIYKVSFILNLIIFHIFRTVAWTQRPRRWQLRLWRWAIATSPSICSASRLYKRKSNIRSVSYSIPFSVYIMRDIGKFFGQNFKIDELRDFDDEDLIKREAGGGSENKAIFTCLGIGYLNLNKGII
jgi:hypothetical protein